jgi:cytoskeletal protein CcmA (bactofilin family)
MGFIANWFGGKSGSSLATNPLMPSSSAHTGRAGFDPHLEHALAVLGDSLPATSVNGKTEHKIRDYTMAPTITPSELSKIMPRDGECSMAVSGLDGVLTIGKDMTMTTDQPIYCQTLRVLGTLEATVQAHKIIIAEGGRVMGSVRVNEAEILGEFDGSLQVRGALAVFPSATLIGKIRATEIGLAKQAKVSAADIKRVVPKVLDGFDLGPMTDGRFEDGYSSMSITVSQKSAIRA